MDDSSQEDPFISAKIEKAFGKQPVQINSEQFISLVKKIAGFEIDSQR